MTGTTAQPSYEAPHERKEQAPVTLKTSVEKKQQSLGEGEGGGGEKTAVRTPARRKLNAPINRVIYVVSYWACACQRPLTSGK